MNRSERNAIAGGSNESSNNVYGVTSRYYRPNAEHQFQSRYYELFAFL